MSETQEITWEDLCKEYPKLTQFGAKHIHLKRRKLCVEKCNTVGQKTYYRSMVLFRSAYFVWSCSHDGQIRFSNLRNEIDIEALGPSLVLMTMYFINNFLKNQINKDDPLHFYYVTDRGQFFLARFLGLGTHPKDFSDYVKKNGTIDGKNMALPFKKFENLVNKEWK